VGISALDFTNYFSIFVIEMSPENEHMIRQLRHEILQLQGSERISGKAGIDFGLGAIAGHFPNGRFPVAAVHELICRDVEGAAANASWVSGLAGRLMQRQGACIWIRVRPNLHPVAFVRPQLQALGNVVSRDLLSRRNGEYIHVAGRILMRQRPGTAHGTVFITIEDETGPINLIVWASVFEVWRKVLLGAKLLMVYGHFQVEKSVRHVIVQRCYNLNYLFNQVEYLSKERNFK
jgi:error-prone DNA polymerase